MSQKNSLSEPKSPASASTDNKTSPSSNKVNIQSKGVRSSSSSSSGNATRISNSYTSAKPATKNRNSSGQEKLLSENTKCTTSTSSSVTPVFVTSPAIGGSFVPITDTNVKTGLLI